MGDAVLVMNQLAAAPQGQDLRSVGRRAAAAPQPAGTFEGGDAVVIKRLDRRVPDGAAVLITQERDGGTDAPTSNPS